MEILSRATVVIEDKIKHECSLLFTNAICFVKQVWKYTPNGHQNNVNKCLFTFQRNIACCTAAPRVERLVLYIHC